MPPKPRDEAAHENEALRQQLRDTEARAHLLLEAVQVSQQRQAFESALAWVTIVAMVLVNALAFAWAR